MLAILCGFAISQTPQYTKAYAPTGPSIEVEMQSGKTFTIRTDPKASPVTVAHILNLVRNGFYNGMRVHRVEYWVTQWGDPLSKTKPMDDPFMGNGGSGPWKVQSDSVGGRPIHEFAPTTKELPFEMSDIDFTRGVVGVASEGLQRGGDCQLFVIKQDRLYLYHSYAVVGMVTQGMQIVDSIKKGDRIRSARVARR